MAYRYQYETSPRKLQPEYEPIKKTYPKKSSARSKNTNKKYKKKTNTAHKVKSVSYVLITFSMLFTLCYRNSLIDEKYAEIKSIKGEIALLQKENDQLAANIESNLNLNHIEKEAQEILGMQKLSNDQIIYVNLPKTDYVETSSEEIQKRKEQNWFVKTFNILLSKIK